MKPIELLLVTLPLLGAFSVEQVQAQVVTPASDGTATIVTTNGNQLNINGGQTSSDGANLFHSFEQFGLNQSQIANFISNPNIQNILAKVSGGDASVINGILQVSGSNANLFLMNPSGIIFGANASLNLNGAFTATTANGIGFGSNWFSATGTNNYAGLTGTPSAFAFTMEQPGAIINAGNLSVGEGKNLTLLAGTVANTGQLNAPRGAITVAAVPGKSVVRLSQAGNILSLDVQPMTTTITQPNNWTLPILSLPQLLTGGGGSNATGLIVNSNGQVELTGSGLKVDANTGTVIASGSIDASSRVAGKSGGSVQVLGDKVGLIDAKVDASGINGGGTVLIGGDYQGKGTVPNASETYVSEDSVITADSLLNGNGGRVIVWADDTTKFYGDINARGGASSGDGGFAEVSGKQQLTFQGMVDLGAASGNFGTLLLDPENITIVDGSVAGNSDPTISEITQTTLEAQNGDVILAATNNITVANLTNNKLEFKNAGSVTFTADDNSDGVGGFSMVDLGDTIETNGASLNISGASIEAGNIISRDSVTLNTTSGNIVIGDVTANNFIKLFGNSGIEAGNIKLQGGTRNSPNSIELRVPKGNIKVKTIDNTLPGNINIVTSGLFQATEFIVVQEVSNLSNYVVNNPTFIQFFKEKTGLTEEAINTNFRTRIPVSVQTRNVKTENGMIGEINIQHGEKPVISGSDFITIQGGNKDIPFVVGAIPSGKLAPGINDDYVIRIGDTYQAINSTNYRNGDISKNEIYRGLNFNSSEFPSNVSGTAGTIAVRREGDGLIVTSIPGRVFTPPPPPPPPVVIIKQPRVESKTDTNNTTDTDNQSSQQEDNPDLQQPTQTAMARQPETLNFGILVLDKSLVASLESKGHATKLSVDSDGTGELTGSDLEAEDEEKISLNQRLSTYPGIYITDSSYGNVNK